MNVRTKQQPFHIVVHSQENKAGRRLRVYWNPNEPNKLNVRTRLINEFGRQGFANSFYCYNEKNEEVSLYHDDYFYKHRKFDMYAEYKHGTGASSLPPIHKLLPKDSFTIEWVPKHHTVESKDDDTLNNDGKDKSNDKKNGKKKAKKSVKVNKIQI